MTLNGAIKQLHELRSAEDMPIYYKPIIAEVINVLLMDTQEEKHGRWLRTDAYPHRIYCSECYATFIRNDEFLKLNDIPHDYCPNCGARMDEPAPEAAEIINDGTYSVGNLYECDPEKNTECRKTGCYINGGECRHTTHAEYVKEDQE